MKSIPTPSVAEEVTAQAKSLLDLLSGEDRLALHAKIKNNLLERNAFIARHGAEKQLQAEDRKPDEQTAQPVEDSESQEPRLKNSGIENQDTKVPAAPLPELGTALPPAAPVPVVDAERDPKEGTAGPEHLHPITQISDTGEATESPQTGEKLAADYKDSKTPTKALPQGFFCV